jgi:hypothetical protein
MGQARVGRDGRAGRAYLRWYGRPIYPAKLLVNAA